MSNNKLDFMLLLVCFIGLVGSILNGMPGQAVIFVIINILLMMEIFKKDKDEKGE